LIRLLTTLAAAAVLTASLGHASTVISCSGDKTAVNSCMNSNLPSFTTRLDLGAVAGDSTLNNNYNHNVVWSTSNVLPGMNISVSDQGTGAGEGLVRAYDLAYYLLGGEWTPGSVSSNVLPYGGYFPGHFNSASDPNASPAQPVGDLLLGLKLNSGSGAVPSMLLSFGASGFDNIGFRVSSILASNFTLRVQVFANTTGTGTPLYDTLSDHTINWNFVGAGGTCASLTPNLGAGQPNPVPCNNAPFIGLEAFNGTAHSIRISTNDAGGFYIGNIYAGTSRFGPGTPSDAPEPGTVFLGSGGLALLIVAQRRYRRRA
jgi:hypothetical protein